MSWEEHVGHVWRRWPSAIVRIRARSLRTQRRPCESGWLQL